MRIPQSVYVIRLCTESENLVKIGRSNDVEQRCADIARARKAELEIMYVTEETKLAPEIEYLLHVHLRYCNIKGLRVDGIEDREWFALNWKEAKKYVQEAFEIVVGRKVKIKIPVVWTFEESARYFAMLHLFVRPPPPKPERWPSAVRDCLDSQEDENG